MLQDKRTQSFRDEPEEMKLLPEVKGEVTERGHKFQQAIARWVPVSHRNLAILSLIARHARTHARLAERACSEEMSERETAQHERKDTLIERRISSLVALLPPTERGPITVSFGGDPRGYTVKLKVPDAPRDGNTWGLGGEYGV